jgi:hypothetical protein
MLPIFQITGRAVWFVASNAFTLFRLSWLPLTVLLAAQYALAYGVIHASPGVGAKALEDTDAYTAASLAEALLMGLALSVVAVAVHRIILFDDRRPNQYFSFPFGKTEFTYVLMGALTFVTIMMLAIALLGSAIIFLVHVVGGDRSDLSAFFKSYPFITIPVALLICAGVLWFALRLTVWPPAVVANNKLSFGEAWNLSRGNALALFGLLIASTVAFYALGGAILIAASKTEMAAAVDLVDRGYLDLSISAKIARLLEGRTNPHIIAFEFATQFFMATYTVAILSYAYKALKGLDIYRPIDGQAADEPGDPDFAPAPGIKPMGKL